MTDIAREMRDKAGEGEDQRTVFFLPHQTRHSCLRVATLFEASSITKYDSHLSTVKRFPPQKQIKAANE